MVPPGSKLHIGSLARYPNQRTLFGGGLLVADRKRPTSAFVYWRDDGDACLDRRIEQRATLAREVCAWTKRRNTHNAKADWRFTTADARIKLKKLYPSL